MTRTTQTCNTPDKAGREGTYSYLTLFIFAQNGYLLHKVPDVEVKSNPAMGLLIFCNEGKHLPEVARKALH